MTNTKSRGKTGQKACYTKIHPFFEEIEKWYSEGMTDIQVYNKLGIGRSRFYECCNNHELGEYRKRGIESQKEWVESKLFDRIRGIDYQEEEITEVGGVVKERKIKKKKALPDSRCIGLYLSSNHANYQNRDQILNFNLDLTKEQISKLTDKELSHLVNLMKKLQI